MGRWTEPLGCRDVPGPTLLNRADQERGGNDALGLPSPAALSWVPPTLLRGTRLVRSEEAPVGAWGGREVMPGYSQAVPRAAGSDVPENGFSCVYPLRLRDSSLCRCLTVTPGGSCRALSACRTLGDSSRSRSATQFWGLSRGRSYWKH